MTTSTTTKTTSKPTTSKTITDRVKSAQVAIDAWLAAQIECDSKAANTTVERANRADTARAFAFDKAKETIVAAAKANGFTGAGGSVTHRGTLYAVVPCEGIMGMMDDARGELTIVSIDLAGMVQG